MGTTVCYAADTLGMPLYQMRDGWVGQETQAIDLHGFIPIEIEINAISHYVGNVESSFFVHFGGHLWGYLLARQSSSLLYIFDGHLAAPDAPVVGKFGGPTHWLDALKAIHKTGAIKAVYNYKTARETWLKLSPAEMQDEIPGA